MNARTHAHALGIAIEQKLALGQQGQAAQHDAVLGGVAPGQIGIERLQIDPGQAQARHPCRQT